MARLVKGSKPPTCIICGEQASSKNKQGLSTCSIHKEEELTNLKCACGDYLDIMTGKYGAYFRCLNCGNINLNKGLDMNDYPLKSIKDL